MSWSSRRRPRPRSPVGSVRNAIYSEQSIGSGQSCASGSRTPGRRGHTAEIGGERPRAQSCADHNPACDRRSACDLRERPDQRDRTQLTALLSPLTALALVLARHGCRIFMDRDPERCGAWRESSNQVLPLPSGALERDHRDRIAIHCGVSSAELQASDMARSDRKAEEAIDIDHWWAGYLSEGCGASLLE